MTPAKRRPATPASQGPTRTAPDVPIVADPRPANTNDGTQLLGPEGEPVADSAPPTETGQVDAEARATRSRGRSGTFYPLPVWPD
jgi:hypothetical protein